MSTALEKLNGVRDLIQSGDGPVQPGQPLAFTPAAQAGDCIHQGDLTFVVLDSIPEGFSLSERPKSKLAKGNTRGANHILRSVELAENGSIPWGQTGVDVFYLSTETMLDGPVLCTKTETEVTHPDHGNVTIPPGMIVQVRYQQNLDEVTREARRSQD